MLERERNKDMDCVCKQVIMVMEHKIYTIVQHNSGRHYLRWFYNIGPCVDSNLDDDETEKMDSEHLEVIELGILIGL